MNKSAREILSHALVLPENDRAALAAELIDSLDPDADAELEAAWMAELSARISAIDRGDVQCVPWDAARRIIAGDGDV